MSLEKYKKKREFDKTPEPHAQERQECLNRFVVQEHDASHLHWDFRLEMEEAGNIVLKSWAVPKGMPEDAGEKRLAVETEDHPVDYIDFHGKIPEGNYGAGTVEIWDRGKYELLDREDKKISFILRGKKAKGHYTLIKIAGYGGRDSWLLIKNK